MRLQNFHDELFQRLTSKMENEDDVDFLERHQQKMEAAGMSYAKYMLLGAIGLAALLIFLFNVFGVDAQSYIRPRYTLTDPRAAFMFTNHDTLPFQVIREMCWDDEMGFCDEAFSEGESSVRLWLLDDWHSDRKGELFLIGDACYWLMYKPEYGDDNSPHVDEHYWTSCP
jgi:hypothetical protein